MIYPKSSAPQHQIPERHHGQTRIGVLICDAHHASLPILNANPDFATLTETTQQQAVGTSAREWLTGSGAGSELDEALASGVCSKTVVSMQGTDGGRWHALLTITPALSEPPAPRVLTITIEAVSDDSRISDLTIVNNAFASVDSQRGNLDSALGYIAHALTPRMYDLCLIYLATDDLVYRITAGAIRGMSEEVMASTLSQWNRAFLHPEDFDQSALVRVVQHGQPLVMTDLQRVTDWHGVMHPREREEIQRLGLGSTIVYPLQTRGPTAEAIMVANTTDNFLLDDTEMAVVETISWRLGAIVERDRIDRQLDEASTVRDRFLSVAAHELRTPIVSLKGYAQLLLRGLQRNTLSPDRLNTALKTISSSIDRLSVLTDDLLEVSRGGLGKIPLRTEPIRSSAYLHSFFARHRNASAMGEHILLHAIDSDAWVSVDTGRLDQVMTNVVANAEKFTDSTEPIVVSSVNERNGVTISIEDRGVGLLPEELDAIFEPFGRGSQATHHNIPGLGLGLFISKNIVEQHGGAMWAESDGVGHGTRISIWLPEIDPPT